MNCRWVQDLLVIIIFLLMLVAQSFFHDDELEVVNVIEQAKQSSLADTSKNELALYRQGKALTTFGDDR